MSPMQKRALSKLPTSTPSQEPTSKFSNQQSTLERKMQEAAKIASMFRTKTPMNYDDSMGSMPELDRLSTDQRGDYSNRSEKNNILEDFDCSSYNDVLHDIEVFFTQIPEKVKQAQMFKSRRVSLVGSLKKDFDAQFDVSAGV